MSNDQVSNLLFSILIFFACILVILVVTLIAIQIYTRAKRNRKPKTKEDPIKEKKAPTVANTTQQQYNKQSIYSFMDFDKIEDNMIIRKNGKRYVMVIGCQGVNYDLMSGVEKASVEQGFLQFLNTLRHPIQIYIQTRTVNLGQSIVTYNEKLKEIENRLVKKQLEYNANLNSGRYTAKELEEQRIEVVKERNLYEYGKDIIDNTERMSLNKNILNQHYYIVIEHMPEEAETANYGKDEIANMAFAELYTKAQSIISSIGPCGVKGKILNSNELAELLYMAYNRDEAEIYGLDKALEARYDDMYSTAPDVIDKKMKALDEKIEEDAIRKANEALQEVAEERKKDRELKQKEAELSEIIRQYAKNIIDANEGMIGKELAEGAKEKIDKEGEVEQNEEKPKTRKRRTTRTA